MGDHTMMPALVKPVYEAIESMKSNIDYLVDEQCRTLQALSLRQDELRLKSTAHERQIAMRQQVSPRSVTTHRVRIRTKLGIKGQRRNMSTCRLAIPDDDFKAEAPR